MGGSGTLANTKLLSAVSPLHQNRLDPIRRSAIIGYTTLQTYPLSAKKLWVDFRDILERTGIGQ